jgi:diguanylate cyclase (GGDEF)-like protein
MAQPGTGSSLFRGRLARRLIVVFALAAIMPVMIASAIAYYELVQSVDSQQQRSLREQAKSASMNLLGQLQLVRATIALPPPADTDVRLLPGGLGTIVYKSVATAGEYERETSDLLPAKATRLKAGDPVLYWSQDSLGVVQWQLLLLNRDTHTLARAQLDTARLLAVAAASGKDTSIRVESTIDDTMMLVDSRGTGAQTSTPDWRSESWLLPLDVDFAAKPVRVIIGAPRDAATHEIDAMQLAIPLTLLAALALAIWLATAQLRRYLGPLEVLTTATRRIADRDFKVSINIDTGDEFAQLGRDFNAMATNLRQQFSTLESVAEVDRLLLRAPSLENILDALLPRIASVLGAERISVLLLDSDSRHHGRAYDQWGDSVPRQVRRIALDSAIFRETDADLRPDIAARVKSLVFGPVAPELARLLPLRHGQEVSGFLCLYWESADAAQRFDSGTALRFADRLSVAVANLSHEQKLLHQARYDGLTGLANRERFAEILREEIARARLRNTRSALLYVDLDEFKNINDSAGHEAGDAVLVEIAERLRTCIDSGDTVARLGGDEFAIAMAGNGDADRAYGLAQRVCQELRRPVTVGGLERRMSASVGIALIPDDGDTMDILLRNADIAMYQAKERGRNQVAAFDPGMLRQMTDRVTLEMELHHALENEGLETHYQPIVSSDGSMAAEALLRWARLSGEGISPAEFIAIAEQSDLILDIGRRVIENVCADMALWRTQGIAPAYVSINVSPRQLHSDDFLPSIMRILDNHGLLPGDIQLEITESAIADGPRVKSVIAELSRRGFRIAIDDFGTGYSSLSHLHVYPFDVVKIDRSFVLDIPGSQVAMQLVGTIIRMAQGLNKTVVAEGVETEEQCQALLELGCDAMQGYLFGRAVDAERFAQMLQGPSKPESTMTFAGMGRKSA